MQFVVTCKWKKQPTTDIHTSSELRNSLPAGKQSTPADPEQLVTVTTLRKARWSSQEITKRKCEISDWCITIHFEKFELVKKNSCWTQFLPLVTEIYGQRKSTIVLWKSRLHSQEIWVGVCQKIDRIELKLRSGNSPIPLLQWMALFRRGAKERKTEQNTVAAGTIQRGTSQFHHFRCRKSRPSPFTIHNVLDYIHW